MISLHRGFGPGTAGKILRNAVARRAARFAHHPEVGRRATSAIASLCGFDPRARKVTSWRSRPDCYGWWMASDADTFFLIWPSPDMMFS